jgi:hypothetical protein
MPNDLRIALLVIGALLLLLSLLGVLLRRLPGAVRLLAGVAGIGLLAWALLPQLLALHAAMQSGPAGAGPDRTVNGTAAVTRPDLTFMAASAITDCHLPAEPAAPPDGTSATRDQMLAAQHAMKAYDAATTVFTVCVDAATRAVLTRYQNIAPASELRAASEFATKLHNRAVDHDQALADRFNRQLRTFLARQRPQHSDRNPLPPTS